MAENKVIVELNGRLVGDGYTLPIATSERLGVVIVGDGLEIDSNGVLSVIPIPIATSKTLGIIKVGDSLSINDDGVLNIKPIEHDAFSKLTIKDINGEISKAAAKRDDVIKIDLKPALSVENISNIPTINLNFGNHLDNDKPMSGASVKAYVDSSINGLRFEFEDLEEWIANLYLSTNSYIQTEIYEVVTDSGGNASLPVTLEDDQINLVFINGSLAVKEKDYQIVDQSIQLTSSEFIPGNDVVTFVVFKSVVDGKTGKNKTINISTEVYETTVNDEDYITLPFVNDNQEFQVFINGIYATKEKDYSVADDYSSIKLENREFISSDDIVTFVVFPTANSVNISSEVYEIETDEFGRAAIPIIPKALIKKYGTKSVHVYINGLKAVDGEDYTIDSENIQLNSIMFDSGNDVITFVVFKAGVVTGGTGGTSDDEEITISDIDQVLSEVEGFND